MTERQVAQQIIGRYIRQLREQKAMTIEDLASKAGISYQYLSGVENGKKNFTISVLEAVANALQYPIKTIILLAYKEVFMVRTTEAIRAFTQPTFQNF